MTDDMHLNHPQSLGEYLRQERMARGLELPDAAENTKIPLHALQAIESDNFTALPADAFARGFYILYAKYLQLNSKEILSRFERERGHAPSSKYPPPRKQVKQVNTMAARPSLAFGSALGFFLVLLIGIIALLCWYFSWNPATFLSEKLRSLQYTPQNELQQENTTSTSAAPSLSEGTNHNESKYILTVDFEEEATATISIDDSFPQQEHFFKNSTHRWYADDTFTLILPESAKVQIYLNGNKILLPDAHDGYRTLKIP